MTILIRYLIPQKCIYSPKYCQIGINIEKEAFSNLQYVQIIVIFSLLEAASNSFHQENFNYQF